MVREDIDWEKAEGSVREGVFRAPGSMNTQRQVAIAPCLIDFYWVCQGADWMRLSFHHGTMVGRQIVKIEIADVTDDCQ